jgi:hypothetical protein
MINVACIGVKLYMREKSTIEPKWPPIYIVQSYESLTKVFYMCVEVT